MESNNQNIESEFNFKYLISLLQRHKNLVILTSLIFLIGSFYYTITVPHSYSATTSILIKGNSGTSAALFDIVGSNKNIEMENEKLMIKSRIVSELAIEKLWRSEHRNNLHLLGTREFVPRAMDERRLLKKILTLGFYDSNGNNRITHGSYYNLDTLRMYAKRINKNLKIANKRNSDIILIKYESPFNDEASLIANTLANSYMEIDRERGANQAKSILSFIENQSKKIEKELSASEEKLKLFKEKHGIFDLSGNSELILNQLIDTESMLYNTIAEVNITQEKKNYLSSKLSSEEKTLANQLTSSINVQLFSLREEISKKEADLVRNATLYGEEHDAVLTEAKEIKALKETLDNRVEEMIQQGLVVADPVQYRQELIQQLLVIENELAAYNAKVKEYENLVSIYNDQLYTLPSLQLSYARLERERSVLNQTYMFMRQRLEEARIQVATESGKVQIIDPAIVSARRDSPNHLFNLLIGLILGLGFSSLFIFIIEYFDGTVKSMDDVGKNLIVLGVIPSMKSSGNFNHSNKFSYRYFKKRLKHYRSIFSRSANIFGNGYKHPERHLITHTQPKSPISEAYRSLRTSLSYSSSDNDFKSLIISSTGPGEGKTTTISNLAITYANLGKKVLLIDTDLRRPVLHKVFNISNKQDGITSYLTGKENNIDSLTHATEIDNLHVITSGVIPPNPSELLASKKMEALIADLKNSWDMVLFDSPPLVAVTDAALMSKSVDKMAMILMPGKTDKKAFSHCLNSLENMGTNLDGVIYNGIDSKNSYGSYYYYYQYYNYYGTTED
tara:strand:+ start:1940 stop:4312 length:2373 start_codon:yes stop_codon:yes gene_type:complete